LVRNQRVSQNGLFGADLGGKIQLLGESLAASVRRELGELRSHGVGSLDWYQTWAALHSCIEATLEATEPKLSANKLADIASYIHAGWLERSATIPPGYCPAPSATPDAPDPMQMAFEQLHKQQQQADGFKWPEQDPRRKRDRSHATASSRDVTRLLHAMGPIGRRLIRPYATHPGHPAKKLIGWPSPLPIQRRMNQGAERVYTLAESKGAASRIGLLVEDNDADSLAKTNQRNGTTESF
jgi:hypothetical protein